MFIAQMWAIGKDPQCVGVDGIVTCMGVFLAYNHVLYAIHSPFVGTAANDLGREAFAYYIEKDIPNYRGKHARLYAVVNGIPRGVAEDEVRTYRRRLKAGSTTFMRLTAGLGPVANPASAAVICEFAGLGNGIVVKYQAHATANWQAGLGRARATHYHMANPDDRFGVASTAGPGWIFVNYQTAELSSLD
jgi:hypothetical protein